MAIGDKIISFWKQVKLRSSDMFTLFKVGVGVKSPTHKLHVKDSTDPMKLEGVQSDTSSSTKFLVLDGSDVVKHTTGAGKTTEEVQDIVGAMFTSNTETRIAATYEDSDGTIDLVVDAIPVDLTVDGAGTVHTNNITDLHGAGVDGSANQLLTDDGDGTVTSETNLTFDGSTLNVGGTNNSNIVISRTANDDNVGGRLYIEAGDAAGTNKAGGDLNIIAGRGTGNAAGGSIFLQSSAAGSSGSSINGAVNIVEIDNVGNVQIDGGLTVGSTSFVNSSGVVQVATQGTIDHDSLANFVANEHIDWTGSSAGTIHPSNIPTLNQDTTGSAATATTAQGITGATDGDVTITSDGHVTVKLDADNDETTQTFKITDNADATVFHVTEAGDVLLSGSKITNSTSDNDLTLETDGSMSFTIDRDNDETAQTWSFINYNATIAELHEDGIFTFYPTTTNNGTIRATRRFFIQHGANYDVSIGDSTNTDVLQVQGTSEVVNVNGALNVTGIVTGKQREVFFQNFFDDLGTTKHYLPFKSQSEQTTIYQEEAAVIMPCDGRIVSVTVRVNFPNADGDMTIGIHTRPVNVSAFTTASWVEEETETLTIQNADDSHAFHFAFDNAKHFESSELVSISIQCSSDISGSSYWYVSTVVEYDWSTFLGTTSAEIDSTP
jgi:hypothetical protein